MSPDEEARRKAAAARIRAARGFAGFTQPDLAEKLGLSLATIKRIESGSRPVSMEELLNIGVACKVPPEFMLHGFDNLTGAIADPMPSFRPSHPRGEIPQDCEARFSELEKRVAGFEETTERIETALRRLYADDEG